MLSVSWFAGGSNRQTWIELCQKTSLDPYELINKHLDELISLVLNAACSESKVSLRYAVRVCWD